MLSEKSNILNCYNMFRKLYDEEELEYYFSKREYNEWDDKYESLKQIIYDYREHLEKLYNKSKNWGSLKFIIDRYIEYFIIDKEYERIIIYLSDVFSHGVAFIEDRNKQFVEKELQRFSYFFNSVDGKELNQQQKEAIVTDEAHNLVIAGAGTGKTLVLEGKVGYLLEKGLAKPDEILVLSFANKVKVELEKRLKDNYGIQNIKTFHSFGNSVIGRKRRVSELANDEKKLDKILEDFLQARIGDICFLNNLHRYFQHYLRPVENILEFKSEEEYNEYIKSYEIRSLKGDLVNSIAELEISNFLFLNSINYEWEKEYPFNTYSDQHGQYLPDFTLTREDTHDIYIEHIGIDEKCNTAPDVDRWDYFDGWYWKRKTHIENGTNLIETYSYERMSGTLLDNLYKKLKDRGVAFQKIPKETVFEKIKELGQVSEFVALLRKFLFLYKSSTLSFADLRSKAKDYPSSQRYQTFIDIFEPIFHDYSLEIKNSGRIDFDDMINEATEKIKNNLYKLNFKYILVDEFQDISQSRYRLLKSLLDQNEETKLLCVGDDWQSIYRFTGSDLSIMTSFEKYFHPVEKLYLYETFRFNDRICDFSSKFIVANPFQYKKNIVAKPADQEGMTLIWYDDINKGIEEALNDISKYEKTPDIMLLGRYNLERYLDIDKTRLNFSGKQQVTIFESKISLPVNYSTIHSFKGKEQDYVIILEVKSGKFGLPCEIEDDPVINLVLAEDDPFPFSEERRTFYVGLSRAIKHAYILANRNRISSFIQEILDGDYSFEILGENPKLITCPDCRNGVLALIKGDKYDDFYSCNRHPLCTFKRELCPECKEGVQYLENESDASFTCSNPNCSYQAIRCPDCDAYLVLIEGDPDFYGCINYKKTGCRGKITLQRLKEISENLASIRQLQISKKSIDYEQEFFNYLQTQGVVNIITATERLTTFGFSYNEASNIIEKWIFEGKIKNSGYRGITLVTKY